MVRVGGSFVFPPPTFSFPSATEGRELRRVVFIAGGVGVNPLVSMLSFICEEAGRKAEEGEGVEGKGLKVKFLYSTKVPPEGGILFLDRLKKVFKTGLLGMGSRLKVFLTASASASLGIDRKGEETSWGGIEGQEKGIVEIKKRRIEEKDLEDAIGKKGDREGTIVYICGVPGMTDGFVERVAGMEGMSRERVFGERWW